MVTHHPTQQAPAFVIGRYLQAFLQTLHADDTVGAT